MSRILRLPREKLSGENRNMYDELFVRTAGVFGDSGDVFLTRRSSDGAFEGPFAIQVAYPTYGRGFIQLNQAAAKLEGLPADARETAILVAGSHWNAVYELYAHGRIATKQAGLAEEHVRALREGRKPDNMNAACELAYNAAMFLINNRGPLPQKLWDEAVDSFGEAGTLKLIHYIGFYSYVSMLLNGCDIPIPDGENII